MSPSFLPSSSRMDEPRVSNESRTQKVQRRSEIENEEFREKRQPKRVRVTRSESPVSRPSFRTFLPICREYNFKTSCESPFCPRRHCCCICGSDHTIKSCPNGNFTWRSFCTLWNCSGSCKPNCPFDHLCLHCKSDDHGSCACPNLAKPTARQIHTCFDFNFRTCGGNNCPRKHGCLICSDPKHNIRSCPYNDFTWKEYCSHWNCGSCSAGPTCRFSHRCIKCKESGHGSFECSLKDIPRKA
ncbi:hypothetical protein BDR26DRAFT_873402 [Obelidium mucronatum]|nr:hypothetical protein BDR26DRAFT_873402 [Obelidium mucronatum]